MSSFAIHADRLSKEYSLGEFGSRGTLSEALTAWRRRATGPANQPIKASSGRQRIWALDDISFELERGDVLGIIGRNGAGKSTLLKILSRITEPTRGRAEIRGRVGSLLEVGTGFHPDLTGRENVFMNGAILGMTNREVRAKFDEIVEFAGIGEFIDTPAKRYSSGMYTRLAFAVAAHLEPEILIVDEVLAVGDLSFQRKCLGKMSNVAGHGRTVIFVSHNMAAVSSLCRQVMVLDKGRTAFIGDTAQAVRCYLADIVETTSISLAERTDRKGEGGIRFVSFDALGADGRPVDVALSGQSVTFRIGIENCRPDRRGGITISIGISTATGQFLSLLGNELTGDVLSAPGKLSDISCRIDHLPLCGGMYVMNLMLRRDGIVEDWIQEAVTLTVEDGDFFGTGRTAPSSHAGVLIPHGWA